MRYSLLQRSEHDVVVLKWPGTACSLTTDPHGRSLQAQLQQRLGLPRVHLVHRLDRVSCGIVVVALSQAAAAFHGAQIQARAWTKLYVARIRAPRGGVEALIGTHRRYLKTKRGRTEIVRSGGKPSSLEVLAVGPSPDRAGQLCVLIELHTGRRHQIRAMLADLGAPLAGDRLYGGGVGAVYLEHVLLRFSRVADGDPRLAFAEAPAFREPWPAPVVARLEAERAC